MNTEKKKTGKVKKSIIAVVVIIAIIFLLALIGDDNTDDVDITPETVTEQENAVSEEAATEQNDVVSEDATNNTAIENNEGSSSDELGARDYMLGSYKYINERGASITIEVDDDSYYSEELQLYVKPAYGTFSYSLTSDIDHDFESDLYSWDESGNLLNFSISDYSQYINVEFGQNAEYIEVSGSNEDVFNGHFDLCYMYGIDETGAVNAQSYLDGTYEYVSGNGAVIDIENTADGTYVWFESGIDELYNYEGDNYTWNDDGSVLDVSIDGFSQMIYIIFGEDADYIKVWGADDEIYNDRFELRQE